MTYAIPSHYYITSYYDNPKGYHDDWDEGFQIITPRPWAALSLGEGVTHIGIAPTNDCGYAIYLPEDHPARLSNPILDIVEISKTPRKKRLRKFQSLSQRQLDQHMEFRVRETEQRGIPFYCFHTNWGGIGDDPFMETIMYASFVRTATAPLTYAADLEKDSKVRRVSLAFNESGRIITMRETAMNAQQPSPVEPRTFYQFMEWRRVPSS